MGRASPFRSSTSRRLWASLSKPSNSTSIWPMPRNWRRNCPVRMNGKSQFGEIYHYFGRSVKSYATASRNTFINVECIDVTRKFPLLSSHPVGSDSNLGLHLCWLHVVVCPWNWFPAVELAHIFPKPKDPRITAKLAEMTRRITKNLVAFCLSSE